MDQDKKQEEINQLKNSELILEKKFLTKNEKNQNNVFKSPNKSGLHKKYSKDDFQSSEKKLLTISSFSDRHIKTPFETATNSIIIDRSVFETQPNND